MLTSYAVRRGDEPPRRSRDLANLACSGLPATVMIVSISIVRPTDFDSLDRRYARTRTVTHVERADQNPPSETVTR
jgi:hypothetical protein